MIQKKADISMAKATLFTAFPLFIPAAPYAEFYVFGKLINFNDAFLIKHFVFENPLKDEHFADISAPKGRNVGQQFAAHRHFARLMRFKASKPDLLKDQVKFESDSSITKKKLPAELNKGSSAIILKFQSGFEKDAIKGFKPYPQPFWGIS